MLRQRENASAKDAPCFLSAPFPNTFGVIESLFAIRRNMRDRHGVGSDKDTLRHLFPVEKP